jgi:hypothetical protein
MGRRRLALGISVVILIACSAGLGVHTSSAERVDVPVVVRIRLRPERTIGCQKDHCRIHFDASVSTDSEEGIWARNCSETVLDGDGRVLWKGPFAFGILAGVFTSASETVHVSGVLEVKMARSHRDRIRTVEGSCLAYVWSGGPPI